MNTLRISGKKCHRQDDDIKLLVAEEAPETKSMKLEIENGGSPKRSNDMWVSSHSTPISKKEYSLNVEDSPELDYRCSPILFPCTQDGGNEIAWDWQSSFSKSTNDKAKTQECNADTPKRTKFLQKKRNPNSPLLHKPLKRKQVKMENIEDIGKFAAELRALSEKMNNIQQNCESQKTEKKCDVRCEPDTQLVVELKTENDSEFMSDVSMKEEKPKCEVDVANINSKKGTSYEDLFNDSIEDCLVKCSQEVEEKLNLIQNKGSDTLGLSMVKEVGELSLVYKKNLHNFTTSTSPTETSKNSNTSKSSSTSNINSYLKSYSKNSSKTNSTSSIHASSPKEQTLQKSNWNNNVITSYNGNARGKNLEQTKSGLYEIPDDSFDDYLATCPEDAKFPSKSFESDDVFSDASRNAKTVDKMHRQASPAATANKKPSSKFVPKTQPFSYNTKLIAHNNSTANKSPVTKESTETSSTIAMENRKFFKTKSLSDHQHGLTRNPGANGVNKSSTSSHAKSGSSFVSNTFPVVATPKPSGFTQVPSSNAVENTHAPNRSDVKEGGTRIIKYKSASDISAPKETARVPQPVVRCTPQEIERKRLEAKMKLEAKRKLHLAMKASNASPGMSIKGPVKR